MQEIKDLTAYRLALKEKILQTATMAFVEKGIKDVKMDDIANALSISKRTLYEIYGDKESLLFEVVKRHTQTKREQLRKYGEEGHHVIEIILEAYRLRVKESHDVNPAFYKDIIRYPMIVKYMESQREENKEQFLLFMQRGVKEGLFRADVDYTILPHLFEAIAQYVMKVNLYNKYSLEEIFTNLLLVPLRGFSTEKGLKILNEAKF
ncbi:MAG: TetR/AcrR family transcriptional regulator [Prevotella sp.]|nr:TetR/AcrR family transcriptional regulator [Prevotella sp.]